VADAYSYRNDPAVPSFPDDRPIVIFDGNCVLCSAFAQFILRTDRRRRFRLMAAQTPLGAALYEHYGLFADDYRTNILLEDGRVWAKSDGSIRIFAGLGFPGHGDPRKAVPRNLRDRFTISSRGTGCAGSGGERLLPDPQYADHSRMTAHRPASPAMPHARLLGIARTACPSRSATRRAPEGTRPRGRRTRHRTLARLVAGLRPKRLQILPQRAVQTATAPKPGKASATGNSRRHLPAAAVGGLLRAIRPAHLAMTLVPEGGRQSLALRHWRAFAIPLPMWLCPRATAHETAEAGRFRFHVEISHPLTGLIVRYRGWLVRSPPS
jgi:predicted DCC family thiol-disulfide oxidoreductase YuxK